MSSCPVPLSPVTSTDALTLAHAMDEIVDLLSRASCDPSCGHAITRFFKLIAVRCPVCVQQGILVRAAQQCLRSRMEGGWAVA